VKCQVDLAEVGRPGARLRVVDDRSTPVGAERWRSSFGLAQPARNRILGYGVAVVGTVGLTAVFLPVRPDLTPLSKGFGFLCVVIAAAAIGGLGSGIAASLLGFVLFNFYFLPPYGTFAIGRAEHVVVLFVFLGLSVLISVLLARATDRARAAEDREAELRALQELSGELVGQVPGREAYERLLGRLSERFGFEAAALYTQDDRGTGGLREEVVVGGGRGDLHPRWEPGESGRTERLPLSVGGRNLGLIVLGGERPPLSPGESRVIRAFCDQLALVLERDRLLRSATQAEIYRRSDDLRRALLAAVSHDLRTPLAVIKTSATDLLEPGVPRAEASWREALEAIDREADRLNVLIANLLDMSRIEAGVLKARLEPVNPLEPVSRCADTVQARWPQVRVDVKADASVPLVYADPIFLERVVTNLLENAAKVAAEAPTHDVSVTVLEVGDRVTVRVADHGPGVPEQLREQLFHPFYRLSERNPRLGPGLGLAIARGFLSLMEGEIWFEATPGGGATFAFSLPESGRSDG
jgi:two-component system sensor histidine kinase KdpD